MSGAPRNAGDVLTLPESDRKSFPSPNQFLITVHTAHFSVAWSEAGPSSASEMQPLLSS